jgi:hypothetical protein
MEQMLRYDLPFAESDCNLHMLEKWPANEKKGRQTASRTMHVYRPITALEARKAVIAAWATATKGAERGCCTELSAGDFVMSRSTDTGMVRLALQPPVEAPVGVTLSHERGVGRLPQGDDSAKLGRRAKAVYGSRRRPANGDLERQGRCGTCGLPITSRKSKVFGVCLERSTPYALAFCQKPTASLVCSQDHPDT